MRHRLFGTAIPALVAAAGVFAATPASAAITIGTDLGGGDLLNVGYGTTGIASMVRPLLFVSQLADTQVAATQAGTTTDLDFSPSVTGAGTSMLDLVYNFSNIGTTTTFTDLRFMLNVQPDGDGAVSFPTFMDNVTESWGAKIAGDPDGREVALFDLTTPLVNQMQIANGLTDGANACGAAPCDADFGLQWNRASLAPGETWSIHVKLVDDPSLVGPGGRYLVATSANTADTQLFVGNIQAVPEPETYAMMFGGLGLLGLQLARRRRRQGN